MIIVALKLDHTAAVVDPSPIAQGTDSENIVLLSPFPVRCPVMMGWVMPDGSPVEIPLDDTENSPKTRYWNMTNIVLPEGFSGNVQSVWAFKPSANLTAQYGKALACFYVQQPVQSEDPLTHTTIQGYKSLTYNPVEINIAETLNPIPDGELDPASSLLEQVLAAITYYNTYLTDIEENGVSTVYDTDGEAQREVHTDAEATEDSNNLITSDAAFKAAQGAENRAKTYAAVQAELAENFAKQYTDQVASTKQNILTFDATPTAGSNNPVYSKGIKSAIDSVINDIPTKTSDLANDGENGTSRYATENFVNSSIGTNTAYFRGTYNIVTDLGLTTSATEQQIIAALANKMASEGITPTNNDYCFVAYPDDSDPTQFIEYDRYKYDGANSTWEYEYTLNNSSFTAAQWAAINSGITATLTSQITTNENDIRGIKNGATINSFSGVESALTDTLNEAKAYTDEKTGGVIYNHISDVDASFDDTTTPQELIDAMSDNSDFIGTFIRNANYDKYTALLPEKATGVGGIAKIFKRTNPNEEVVVSAKYEENGFENIEESGFSIILSLRDEAVVQGDYLYSTHSLMVGASLGRKNIASGATEAITTTSTGQWFYVFIGTGCIYAVGRDGNSKLKIAKIIGNTVSWEVVCNDIDFSIGDEDYFSGAEAEDIGKFFVVKIASDNKAYIADADISTGAINVTVFSSAGGVSIDASNKTTCAYISSHLYIAGTKFVGTLYDYDITQSTFSVLLTQSVAIPDTQSSYGEFRIIENRNGEIYFCAYDKLMKLNGTALDEICSLSGSQIDDKNGDIVSAWDSVYVLYNDMLIPYNRAVGYGRVYLSKGDGDIVYYTTANYLKKGYYSYLGNFRLGVFEGWELVQDASDIEEDIKNELLPQISTSQSTATEALTKVDDLFIALNKYVLGFDEETFASLTNAILPSSITVDNAVYPIADGANGILSSVKGNTKQFNQLINHGNFDATTGFSAVGMTISVSNNVATLMASSSNNRLSRQIPIKNGHKYFYTCDFKLTTETTSCGIMFGNVVLVSTANNTNWQTLSGIYTATADSNNYVSFFIRDWRISDWDSFQVRNYMVVDLTAMGLDSITTVEEFTALYPKAYYPYNAGTLYGSVISGVQLKGADQTTVTGTISLPSTQTLGGVGTAQDEIAITKNENDEYYTIKKTVKTDTVTLDGTKGGYNSNQNWYYISLITLNISTADRLSILCDKVAIVDIFTDTTGNGMCINENGTHFIIRNTSFTTATEYQNWLATNLPTVRYVKATPVETTLTETATLAEVSAIRENSGMISVVGNTNEDYAQPDIGDIVCYQILNATAAQSEEVENE